MDGIDATKVYGYALIKDGRVSCVKYPTENYRFEVAGRSFHHGRFVQKLRTKASKSPGVTLRQGIVRKLLGVDCNDWVEETGATVGGVRYKQEDGKERTARGHLTVVCDGMYSAFRSKLWDKEKNVAPKIATPSFFVGLLLKNVHLPFPNHGHVLLGDPSPALFYPISSTEVRCLVDVPWNKLPSVSDGAMSEYLMTNVYPQVPASLQEAFQRAVVDGQIKAMQNKAVSAKPLRVMGALLLGDAYNMRHPLTGGGMTVALSDTKLICDMLQGLDADGMASLEAVTKATNSFYQTRKPLAGTINTLANALYRVFQYRPWAAHEEMRQACFEYLSLGGKCAAGPVSLLSGLNPSPSVLVAHFFSVAFFAMARLLLPRPTLKGLYMSIMVLVCASSIILPILVNEGCSRCCSLVSRRPAPGSPPPILPCSRKRRRWWWS